MSHFTSRIFVACSLLLAKHVAADDAGIRFFEARVKSDPEDFIAWNHLADRCHRELRRAGDDRFLAREQEAAEHSLKAIAAEQNTGGLAALAQARLTAHRFTEARDAARQLRELQPGKARPLELLADALTELGDYDEAKSVCDELVKLPDSQLSAAPRLAKLAIVFGHHDRAREHFAAGLAIAAHFSQQEPDLVAWFHIQLGELAFKTGDWEGAEKHYTAAAQAWPDGYSAEDHLAELRAAQSRIDESIAQYEKLAARVPRPEFFQALADICALSNRAEPAAAWAARAEEAYLRSVGEGAVHYRHHLAGFYADTKEEHAKAVEWARKDLELRHSIFAHDALAWALYKNGASLEAAEHVKKAMATGTQDPHLLYHAGLIRMATGDIAGGKAALQQASAVNAKFNTFHVHR